MIPIYKGTPVILNECGLRELQQRGCNPHPVKIGTQGKVISICNVPRLEIILVKFNGRSWPFGLNYTGVTILK